MLSFLGTTPIYKSVYTPDYTMGVKVIGKERAGFRVVVRDTDSNKTRSFSLSKNSLGLEDIIKKLKEAFK